MSLGKWLGAITGVAYVVGHKRRKREKELQEQAIKTAQMENELLALKVEEAKRKAVNLVVADGEEDVSISLLEDRGA